MSSRPALATEVDLGWGSEMAQHVKGTLAEPDLSFIPGIHQWEKRTTSEPHLDTKAHERHNTNIIRKKIAKGIYVLLMRHVVKNI